MDRYFAKGEDTFGSTEPRGKEQAANSLRLKYKPLAWPFQDCSDPRLRRYDAVVTEVELLPQ